MLKQLLRAFWVLAVCLPFQAAQAQQHSLVKLWQTDTLLKTPESVLYDAVDNLLYVSNIDGQPWEKDGKGSIGKITLDGKIVQTDWVSGLECPKGLARYKKYLYVADAGNLVIIDIAGATIVQRATAEGIEGLNDVTVDSRGKVYVTDSKTGKIYFLDRDKLVLFAENYKGLNGVLAVGTDVYAVAAGALYKIDATKTSVKIAEGMEPAVDGIVNTGKNEFVVSVWNGVIYYINAAGQVQQLLDTREQKSNTADIGYNPATRTLYVPTFFKNSVVAYRLN